MIRILRLVLFLIVSQTVYSQDAIYHDDLNHKLESNETILRSFSIKSTNKLSVVSLSINGYDKINNNILPVIILKINNKILFTGILSDYTYGKNNSYGEIEFNITNYIKAGNNVLTIQYVGLTAGSFNYIKNINITAKYSGIFYKNLSDFNYNQSLYTNYLRKTLTLESTVIATEDYQKVSKGMKGTYYGEATFNPNFCCIKWLKNLNSNINCPSYYPIKYKSYAFYVPYANIKIDKLKTFGDNQPPAIRCFANNNISVENKTMTVSGQVTDKNGIYAVYVNNIKTITDKSGFYKLNFPLDVGKNRIVIKAFDDYGNSKTELLSVTRTISNNDLQPQISIFYPVEQETSVFINSIKIQGEVTDDNAVSYVQAIVNSIVYKIFVGVDNNFSVDLSLLKGENFIEIYAFDEVGNESEHEKITVIFEPDAAKPQITLLNPTGLSDDNILIIDKDLKELPVSVVVNSHFPINDVSISYVNVPVSIPLTISQKNTFNGVIKLPMSEIISISIVAKDIHNTTEVFMLSIKRRKETDPFLDIDNNFPVTGKKCDSCYALIIGNAEYNKQKSLFNSLPYVKNDAEIFQKYLINTYGVPSLNIQLANNVGLVDFMNEINNFTRKIENHPNGKFLFYYSGHGAISKNETPYFVPVDYSESTDSYNFFENLFIESVIHKMLIASPARLTVILDMCYSGKEGKGVSVGTYNFDFSGQVVIFTAAESEAYSFQRRNHSLFTYALLKNIQESNGNITYKELSQKTQQTINNIIEFEELNFNQKSKIIPSSILDDEWENWQFF